MAKQNSLNFNNRRTNKDELQERSRPGTVNLKSYGSLNQFYSVEIPPFILM